MAENSNELDRAYEALRQAHEAGNAEDAQQIADYIRTIEPQTKAPKAPVEGLQSPELWAIGGVPAALAAGRAMEGFEQGRLREMARQARVHVPEEVIQQGRNAVINYIKAMHTGDINYVGGEDYKRAHALTEEAKIKDTMAPKGFRYDPFKQRYVSEQEFRANLQQVEQQRLAQQKAGAPPIEKLAGRSPGAARAVSGVGGMLRKGVAPPFFERSAAGLYGGYSAADAINRAKQGDIPGAAISGTGALGSALTVSKNPKARALGLGLAGLSMAGNKMYESPAEEGPGFSEAAAPYYEGAKSFFGYKAGGQIQGYADGGGTPKTMVAKAGLNALKKAFAPKPTKVVRASEALGPHADKYLYVTESDRMRSTGGDLGGPGFSKFQLEDPRYAEAQAAWGVASKPKASAILNINKRFPEDKVIWSPLIGAEGQHRSNQHVYDMLTNEFSRQAGMGKLSPELREAMNKRLATWQKYAPVKLQGIDVANPEHLKKMGSTFDRRAAIAEVLGGEGVGGRKGQIFDYPGIMQEMTDPMVIGAPTHSVGTRLFSLSGDVEHRPDLHSAFPYILKGEDKGVAFNAVPKELMLGDWIEQVKDFTGREPGYMEFMRGVKGGHGKPNQFLSQEFLRKLEDAGHKEGGPVHLAKGGDAAKKLAKMLLPPAENAARTQIIGTLPTYRKAADIFKSRGAEGRGLDFGAGLGEGAKVMPGRFETYEPFASGWTPTYSDISQIPQEAYNRLTNLNVLNVVPREMRDEIVQGIGRSIEPGGMGIITTRGKDVMSAKGRPGPEPMSIITSRDTYQKGFTPAELQEYLKYMLGEGYDIERLGLGPAGAMIRKKAEGGLAQMAKGGHSTPAWQRKEGQNPEGGLNAAGRASYKRETGGELKRPQPEGGPRRDSFCARMKGMKKKLTSAETANDPDSRINKSLRAWNC